jgi:hypothetical protein
VHTVVCKNTVVEVVTVVAFSPESAVMAPNSSAQRFGQKEQPLRTTFGRLEGVSDCVVLPSTLGYRELQLLQNTAGFEYGK